MTKETCVLCGKKTPFNKSDNIDYRCYYVEGAGQLCKDCYRKLGFDK